MDKLLELLSESNGQLSAARMISYSFALMALVKMGISILGNGEPLTWEEVALVSSALGWKALQKKSEK